MYAAHEDVAESIVTFRATALVDLGPTTSPSVTTASLTITDAGASPMSSTVTVTIYREHIRKENSTKKTVTAYIMQVNLLSRWI